MKETVEAYKHGGGAYHMVNPRVIDGNLYICLGGLRQHFRLPTKAPSRMWVTLQTGNRRPNPDAVFVRAWAREAGAWVDLGQDRLEEEGQQYHCVYEPFADHLRRVGKNSKHIWMSVRYET